MEQTNQKSQCQQLWARNKYLVLSHSSNIYNDIRQYLKQEVVEVSQVQEMIERACQIPEHRGQVCNAFQHIWGYFKKQATIDERKAYMLLLDCYRFGQASASSTLGATSRVLRPSWQWLGQKACDSGLCLYPLALSSLCLSSLDHGGDG